MNQPQLLPIPEQQLPLKQCRCPLPASSLPRQLLYAHPAWQMPWEGMEGEMVMQQLREGNKMQREGSTTANMQLILGYLTYLWNSLTMSLRRAGRLTLGLGLGLGRHGAEA